MAARDEVLNSLRNGQTPGQISRARGTSLSTTLQYLNQLVGQGRLQRSEILFSIPREAREAIAAAGGQQPVGIDDDDFQVVELYQDSGHTLGDMYMRLHDIETLLHAFICIYLKDRLGKDEAGWWRKGIPEAIRKSCQTRREEDDEPASHPYRYTDLLDLGRILEHNWFIFQPCMPPKYSSNRRQMLDDFRHLNAIRRMVMHPVRGGAPDEDAFQFVHDVTQPLAKAMGDALEPLSGRTDLLLE